MTDTRSPDRPDPQRLAAAANARHRVATRTVSEDRFATLRQRIADGFEWGVGALLTDDRDRVLLVYEDGRWLLPGGEVEPGETFEGALFREVYEETTLEIDVGSLVAVTEQTVRCADEAVDFQFAIFRGSPESGPRRVDHVVADDAVADVAWVSELPPDTLDRSFLRELLGRSSA